MTYRSLLLRALDGLSILLVLVAIVPLLAGCSETKPQPALGSAVAFSVSEHARAASLQHDADAAAIEAARLQAIAVELEKVAKASGIQRDIDAAVNARLAAAVGQAVSSAQQASATRATTSALGAEQNAAKERAQDAEDQDVRAWVKTCRWIGLAGVAIGALLGGVISWLIDPKVGVPIGCIVSGVGLLVTGYGSTVTWLPTALFIVVMLAGAVWAFFHNRLHGVAFAASETIDAVEGTATKTAGHAKAALEKAIGRAGLTSRVESARNSWENFSGRKTDVHPANAPTVNPIHRFPSWADSTPPWPGSRLSP